MPLQHLLASLAKTPHFSWIFEVLFCRLSQNFFDLICENLHSICFLSVAFASVLALFLRQKRRNQGVKFGINNVRYMKYKSQKPREKDVPAEFQGGN